MAPFQTNVGSTSVLVHSVGFPAAETVRIVNIGNNVVYLGGASSVSTTTGLPCGIGSEIALHSVYGANIYAICGTGLPGQLLTNTVVT
jgi:hypothetical protein